MMITPEAKRPLYVFLFFMISSMFISPLLSGFFFICLIFTLFFFRDPERKIGDGLVSPADGYILDVKDLKVTIFMSLFDVHVNRSPVDGKIVSIKKIKGSSLPAFLSGASNNAKEVMKIQTKMGKLTLERITGFLARRITTYVNKGEKVKKGQRLGVICFGSRCEVTIPPTHKIVVKKGQKVYAGSSTLARPF
jgi:phosphatidylserine decarboxylase